MDKMEHPERFDYAAPIQAYGKKASDGSRIKGVRVDRAFKPGETFEWEGYRVHGGLDARPDRIRPLPARPD